jgi:hypothetical protein
VASLEKSSMTKSSSGRCVERATESMHRMRSFKRLQVVITTLTSGGEGRVVVMAALGTVSCKVGRDTARGR